MLQMGNFPNETARFMQVIGEYKNNDGERSKYCLEKYQFLLDAKFSISDRCCRIIKKAPAHDYGKKTSRKPIIATMAEESLLRTQGWIKTGCNSFDGNNASSKPMSFWTEQDVLLYIKMNNLPICSVYGDVVVDYNAMNQVDNQMDITDFMSASELEIFELDKPKLKTTGCSRTGCVLCGFGCHLEKSPNRFERLKETHPKFHNLLYVLKNNGVTYAEAIDWINEHGNLNIKY